MNKAIIVILICNFQCILGQNVIEVVRPVIPVEHFELFIVLDASRDSGPAKGIEILEMGLSKAGSDHEKYQIMINFGYLYTETAQYDKCIDMWKSANAMGIYFPFEITGNPDPEYLADYAGNERFKEFMESNHQLISEASVNSKAEYCVSLPETG